MTEIVTVFRKTRSDRSPEEILGAQRELNRLLELASEETNQLYRAFGSSLCLDTMDLNPAAVHQEGC